ncbi:hypothetical protein KG088_17360 [Halomonas sp. TRM85114]|uniref:hypothetical protein n=1 Tax=Halomonas jincaotanensis TaxID=2810616 RepID=UPI001BD36560|nr:hypothetical protein [Halomonas jincaotanensis]MBS9405381.1 hypothetical protein [Halomonas jincaotanensis]
MNVNATVFLRALDSVMTLEDTQTLGAEGVNAISQSLGLSLETIPALMETLKREGLVDLQWGGTVSLTAKGRDLAEGKTKGRAIQIEGGVGQGAIVVVDSPGAVARAEAMGSGAQRVEYRANTGLAVADLVALLNEVRRLTPQLESEAQPVAQELGAALEDTLKEAKQPTPDKASLEQHLERATGLMERLRKISEAVLKLVPVLEGIRRLCFP